jgi:hypothetical protein
VIAPDPARLQALEALSAALGDPHRLVDELLAAQDDADARVRVSAGFGLTDAQAQVVLDNRFGLLSRTRRAELAEDLQAERTPLGPELHLQAVWDPTGRTVTVSVDGIEIAGRGRTAAKAVEELATRVMNEVARPRHRPVVVQVDGIEGMEQFVAIHNGIRFYSRDELSDDDS